MCTLRTLYIAYVCGIFVCMNKSHYMSSSCLCLLWAPGVPPAVYLEALVRDEHDAAVLVLASELVLALQALVIRCMALLS